MKGGLVIRPKFVKAEAGAFIIIMEEQLFEDRKQILIENVPDMVILKHSFFSNFLSLVDGKFHAGA